MATQTLEHHETLRSGQSVRIVVASADYARMCEAVVRRLPSPSRARLDMVDASGGDVVDPCASPRHPALPTFFILRVADIPELIAHKTRPPAESKYLLFAEGLPVEAVASRLPRLAIRDARRLHVARASDRGEIGNLVSRLIRGITQPDGPARIVDAWIEERMLVLLSPSFERLMVPLDKLDRYIGGDPARVNAFDIDEDGSFLYWPHADAHFGFEQFVSLVDPTASLAARQKTQAFNRRYGAAIRALRVEAGLKQADVAGVTERNLRRVEHGELAASKTTLESLAKTHGLTLEDYLKKLAGRLKRA